MIAFRHIGKKKNLLGISQEVFNRLRGLDNLTSTDIELTEGVGATVVGDELGVLGNSRNTHTAQIGDVLKGQTIDEASLLHGSDKAGIGMNERRTANRDSLTDLLDREIGDGDSEKGLEAHW